MRFSFVLSKNQKGTIHLNLSTIFSFFQWYIDCRSVDFTDVSER